MLTVNDLININRIPEEKELSLSLLLDFYESYLCNRIFIFTLENGESIKLLFKISEIFHISGIDHIYENVPMDPTRFISEVRAGTLTLERVESVNPAAYKDYLDRIRSMFCMDTILKQCKYLYFSKGKIPNSDIRVSYLLLKGLDGKNLHLGIDRYKVKRPYFSRTLLITEGNSAEKYRDVSEDTFAVSRLEIRDKSIDESLEIIDRQQAATVTEDEIGSKVTSWLNKNLESLIRKQFENETVLSQIAKIAVGTAARHIGALNPDIAETLSILADMPRTERASFLYEILKTVFEEDAWLTSLHEICASDSSIYKEVFDNATGRGQKDIWKKEISQFLQQEKGNLCSLAIMHDPYGYSVIVAERIRVFEKNDCLKLLNNKCMEFCRNDFPGLISGFIHSLLASDRC